MLDLSPLFMAASDVTAPVPLWTIVPFALMLTAIAVAPLAIPHLWHRWYPAISCGMAGLMAAFYVGIQHDPGPMVHAAFEYFSFISLLASLFLATSGVVVDLRMRATPLANVAVLLVGAVIANVVGTTGASLLLIRPFLRINQGRLRPYHVVFFIFMVSNVGGALTPIGDPPLFLGYLRGIDFFRFFTLALPEWLTIGNIELKAACNP